MHTQGKCDTEPTHNPFYLTPGTNTKFAHGSTQICFVVATRACDAMKFCCSPEHALYKWGMGVGQSLMQLMWQLMWQLMSCPATLSSGPCATPVMSACSWLTLDASMSEDGGRRPRLAGSKGLLSSTRHSVCCAS